jgi:hypothetical protein
VLAIIVLLIPFRFARSTIVFKQPLGELSHSAFFVAGHIFEYRLITRYHHILSSPVSGSITE